MTKTNLMLGNSSVRELDGLYNLNDLHAAAGGNPTHRPHQFLRNAQTQALVAELETAQICAVSTISGRAGGTYACRELVIAYAAWISAEFHLKVISEIPRLQRAGAATASGATASTAAHPRRCRRPRPWQLRGLCGGG
ncbi:MAG: KilA-N domain-containing protein [Pseudomonadales bacterium]|jgi:hypothetical protein|nr:KilA-N domain-containing protein [Pseudomonadales bacterium]